MKRKMKIGIALCLLAAFAVWTVLVCRVDVQCVGPQGTAVGFAAMNLWFHRLTGVHMALYTLTDWLGLVPIGIAVGFALLGLGQWVHRKRLRKVDRSILILGGFYLAVMAAFLFFEEWIVNYRPVLINGQLEASYPSSTTLLVMCVMPTAGMQLSGRIKNSRWKRCIAVALYGFTGWMVLGRLVSGVHWLSDIVGGILLSGGLVLLYAAAADGAKR